MRKLIAVAGMAVALLGVAGVSSPAHAGIATSGDSGVLSGDQVIVPVIVPVDISDVNVAVLGVVND